MSDATRTLETNLTPSELLRQKPIEVQMRDAAGRNYPDRPKDELLLAGAHEIERLREYEWMYKELQT